LTKTILFGKGALVAILILNAFILTTLDTATRIARYISEELFKINNRFFATFVIVFMSGSLAITGSWKKIWPVFGASNQLVAALTFIVIASWLLCRGKSIKFVFLPCVFMLLTTIGALLFQIVNSFKNGEFIIVVISAVLAVLAVLMVLDVFSAIRRKGLKCRIF
jgi:carbon starvation protein